MRINDVNQQPSNSRLCVGDNGEFMSMAQFALMIQKAGGKVVAFVDQKNGINLAEADIDALVENENGRSN